uniref:Uncharacterized protein n=1 Tax=Mycena chlorophos TaxID=658473 RepID=A0ABQ0LG10_MYCCL|nr:predicted protein [Mycena chlorophos]
MEWRRGPGHYYWSGHYDAHLPRPQSPSHDSEWRRTWPWRKAKVQSSGASFARRLGGLKKDSSSQCTSAIARRGGPSASALCPGLSRSGKTCTRFAASGASFWSLSVLERRAGHSSAWQSAAPLHSMVPPSLVPSSATERHRAVNRRQHKARVTHSVSLNRERPKPRSRSPTRLVRQPGLANRGLWAHRSWLTPHADKERGRTTFLLSLVLKENDSKC